MALGMSAVNTMIIRDAAIEAANRSALAGGQGQREYLMQLLDESLPTLASYQVEEAITPQFTGYRVSAQLPGLGVLPLAIATVEVKATREVLV